MTENHKEHEIFRKVQVRSIHVKTGSKNRLVWNVHRVQTKEPVKSDLSLALNTLAQSAQHKQLSRICRWRQPRPGDTVSTLKTKGFSNRKM